MRLGFLAAIALALSVSPADAADPPIVFQTHPVGQVLDEVRTAANLIAGENGVKAFNKALERKLGEKGFEGIDIGRPIVGYVNLTPKPEDITAVIALPITDEKEFLDLCERNNHQKPKLVENEKDLYELPPLDPGLKAVMRFADQYAYIATGLKPAPALDPKAIVPFARLYVPTETGLVAGRIYFDRLTPELRQALPGLLDALKTAVKNAVVGIFFLELRHETAAVNAVMAEVDKLVARYAKLLTGANELAARIELDMAAGNLVVEASLTGKPGSELAANIAAFKPTANRFGGLIATPDTIAGFTTRLPLFEEEIRAAAIAALEEIKKEALKDAKEAGGKASVEELFKGLTRTVKTGEFDIAGGLRGPNKNGFYTGLLAIGFDNPAAFGKEFRGFLEKEAPAQEQENFKWDAAKVGNVGVHTYKVKGGGFLDITEVFGGDDCSVAFAFAPEGVFIVIGPDSVETMKGALAVKPTPAPVFHSALNPARVAKLFAKLNPDDAAYNARVEAMLGKDDKLVPALSATLVGGQELKATLTINLRMLPRILFADAIERAAEREKNR